MSLSGLYAYICVFKFGISEGDITAKHGERCTESVRVGLMFSPSLTVVDCGFPVWNRRCWARSSSPHGSAGCLALILQPLPSSAVLSLDGNASVGLRAELTLMWPNLDDPLGTNASYQHVYTCTATTIGCVSVWWQLRVARRKSIPILVCWNSGNWRLPKKNKNKRYAWQLVISVSPAVSAAVEVCCSKRDQANSPVHQSVASF